MNDSLVRYNLNSFSFFFFWKFPFFYKKISQFLDNDFEDDDLMIRWLFWSNNK